MFNSIRRFFRSRSEERLSHQEYLSKRNRELIEQLDDEIILLNKLCNKKEIREIGYGSFFSISFMSNPTVQPSIEKERQKCRDEGFSYCHTKKNGNEIWAKY